MFEKYNDVLNVEEMCEILNIGKNVAYQLLDKGVIRAFKLGRIWKIPKATVEEYILKMADMQR